MTTQLLLQAAMPENTCLVLTKIDRGFSVVLYDHDAAEYLPTAVIFKTRHEAQRYFDREVDSAMW